LPSDGHTIVTNGSGQLSLSPSVTNGLLPTVLPYWPNTIYVSVNGSDTNLGTNANSPFLTLTNALTQASNWGGSNLIILGKGDFYFPTNTVLSTNTAIAGQGAVATRLIASNIKWSGLGYSAWQTPLLVVAGDNVSLRNLTIMTNCANMGTEHVCYPLDLESGTNLVFDHLDMQGQSDCIFVDGANPWTPGNTNILQASWYGCRMYSDYDTYFDGGLGSNNMFLFKNCEFHVFASSAFADWPCHGIHNFTANLTIEDCEFDITNANNSGANSAYGIELDNALSYNGPVSVRNCTFNVSNAYPGQRYGIALDGAPAVVNIIGAINPTNISNSGGTVNYDAAQFTSATATTFIGSANSLTGNVPGDTNYAATNLINATNGLVTFGYVSNILASKTNAVLYGATNGATGRPLADLSVTNLPSGQELTNPVAYEGLNFQTGISSLSGSFQYLDSGGTLTATNLVTWPNGKVTGSNAVFTNLAVSGSATASTFIGSANALTGTNVANSGNLQSGGTNPPSGMVPTFTGTGGAWTAQTPSGGGGGTITNGPIWITSAKYNAVPNGSTDNTLAISNAVWDAAASNTAVYIPPGNFVCGCITTSVPILGSGRLSHLIFPSANTGYMITGLPGFYGERFWADGGSATNFLGATGLGARHGVSVNITNGIGHLNNVDCIGFSGYGIAVTGDSGNVGNRMDNGRISGCHCPSNYVGIYVPIIVGDYMIIDHNWFNVCATGASINSANVTFDDNDCNDCNTGYYGASDSGTRLHCDIHDNSFTHCGNPTMVLSNFSAGCLVHGNNFLLSSTLDFESVNGLDFFGNLLGGQNISIDVHGGNSGTSIINRFHDCMAVGACPLLDYSGLAVFDDIYGGLGLNVTYSKGAHGQDGKGNWVNQGTNLIGSEIVTNSLNVGGPITVNGVVAATNGYASYGTNILLAGSATSWNGTMSTIASGITNTYGTNMTFNVNCTSGTVTLYSAGGVGGVNVAANAYFTGALAVGMSEFHLPANWGIQITSGVGVTAAAHF
jgi:hypothetical protein